MGEAVIRAYEKKDREAVRDIAYNTAFFGSSADKFFDLPESLKDLLTAYFTDYESQSCFVAELDGCVIGYIIGAKDSKKMEEVFLKRIALQLFPKFIFLSFFKKKSRIFLWRCFLSFLKGEFSEPDFYKDYPAVLHINLREGFRAQGLGYKLMQVYLKYLLANRVRGVRLATMSQEAYAFFIKSGFELLYSAPRSYFKQVLGKDITIYSVGKKLLLSA